MFEAAQEAAEQYLMNIKLLGERASEDERVAEPPFGSRKISSIRKVRNPRSASQMVPGGLGKAPDSAGQVVPISLGKAPGSQEGLQESKPEQCRIAAASGGFYG